jgi:hypothetical protein
MEDYLEQAITLFYKRVTNIYINNKLIAMEATYKRFVPRDCLLSFDGFKKELDTFPLIYQAVNTLYHENQVYVPSYVGSLLLEIKNLEIKHVIQKCTLELEQRDNILLEVIRENVVLRGLLC